MNSIEIIKTGKYLPKNKVDNKQIENDLKLEEGYIKKRTGIESRFYVMDEKIEEMALEAVKSIFQQQNEKINHIQEIDLIITATTTSDNLMPGISNYIQKKLKIKECISLDILARM